MQKPKLTLLQRTATTFIDLYGNVRNAGAKLKISHPYLYRLKTGEQSNPSDEVLDKLGLERIPGLEIHRKK